MTEVIVVAICLTGFAVIGYGFYMFGQIGSRGFDINLFTALIALGGAMIVSAAFVGRHLNRELIQARYECKLDLVEQGYELEESEWLCARRITDEDV